MVLLLALFLAVSVSACPIPALDSDDVISANQPIFLNLYENPMYAGKGISVKVPVGKDDICVNMPEYFDNKMSSFNINHGVCDFFDYANCNGLIFS